ncbi:unnamed protein product [Caenorhabditis auriculariae]|uniref:SAP domain-containing protein n=1 Tax=Caenorhabditis auriculariae TaxID=2777116 RepID=A0A8S1GN37_9PELO|nr:unnamed protein product [Caenorhabditis auriculariae]
MSDEDPLVNGVLLSTLRVVDLKEALDERGLSKIGNKQILQDRLRDSLLGRDRDSPLTSPTKSASSTKLGSPPTNPLVAEYLAKQQAALQEAKVAHPHLPAQDEETVKKAPKVETEAEAEQTGVDEERKKDSEDSESVQTPKNDKRKEEKAKATSGKSEGEKNSVEQIPVDPEICKQEEDPVPERADRTEKGNEFSVKVEDLTSQDSESETSSSDEPDEKMNEAIAGEDSAREKTAESHIIPPEKEKKETKKAQTTTTKPADDDLELDYGDENEDEKDREETTEAEKSTKNGLSEGTETKKKSSNGTARVEVLSEGKIRDRAHRVSSPSSRHPVSDVVHIRGLVRPFTENMLRNEITKDGANILDFWMDKVKSHCFVKLDSLESATAVRNAMSGKHWPDSNPKELSVCYDTDENMERYKEGKVDAKPLIATIGSITGRSRPERVSTSSSAVAPPSRGNLRVTVEAAVRENTKREVAVKKEPDQSKPRSVRPSEQEKGRDRRVETEERKRRRSPSPQSSRSRFDEKRLRRIDEDHDRLRDGGDGRNLRREPIEEEIPTKTPDELFKKTSTTPALYFLPLTDEQVAQKQKLSLNNKSEQEMRFWNSAT